MNKILPRNRCELAQDWERRIDNFSTMKVGSSVEPWADVAGLRFRGNAAWLSNGAGRALQHDRDLSSLELYYHDFMRQGILWPSEAWGFLESYLESHIQRVADSQNEWHPYAVSNRLASWLEFMALAPSPEMTELREKLARECLLLADYVAWLLENDIEANHLLKNLWSIALCDLLLCPCNERIQASIHAYLVELERQVLPDGGHYELSPMYHAKLLMDARVIESLLAEHDSAKKTLRQVTGKATRWLEHMRMSSDSWANINDSWSIPGLARRLWGEQSWSPESSLTHLENSGFVRGIQENWHWLFDVGGMSPSFNPGHCHSDSLSVLVYHDEVPVIVDPGVLHYSPNDERRYLKSCHAHNGPCLRDSDNSELIGSFRVGRSGRATLETLLSEGSEQSATAKLEGYFGLDARREILSKPDALTIVDTWISSSTDRPVLWSRFLWNASLTDVEDCQIDSNGISLRYHWPKGDMRVHLQIRVSGVSDPRLGVQDSFYSHEFGKKISAFETIVTGRIANESAQIRTTIRIVV